MEKIYELNPTPVTHVVPHKEKTHASWGKPRPWWRKIMNLPEGRKGRLKGRQKLIYASMNKEDNSFQKFQDWMQKQNYASTSTVLTPTFGGAGPGKYYQENTELNKHQTDKTHTHKSVEGKETHYPTGEVVRKQIKNPFAVATAQAKKLGFKNFSEGSSGREKRDEIAEALKPGITKNIKTGGYPAPKQRETPWRGKETGEEREAAWGRINSQKPEITKHDMFMEWMEKHLTNKEHSHKYVGPYHPKGIIAVHHPSGRIETHIPETTKKSWLEKHNPKSGVPHKHPGPGKGVKIIKKKIPKEFSLRPSGSTRSPFFKNVKEAIKTYSKTKTPEKHQSMLEAFRAWERSKYKGPKHVFTGMQI